MPAHHRQAAAFGRLCVETSKKSNLFIKIEAAAFGRLCVETRLNAQLKLNMPAAAFGRLCVETHHIYSLGDPRDGSRLRAAVC